MLYSLLTIILSALPLFAQPLTPSPTSQQAQVTPAPTLNARCDTCTGGSTETTLSAETVTTTIESITSVPCTTTVFVTDSTTTTSTIYSTQTISMTSTITEEGTVYIVHYQPTPIVQSATYETVIPVTETLTSYWVSESGSGYDSTYTGSTTTQGGTTGWGTATSSPCATSTGGDDSGGNAWTHVGGTTGGVGATYDAVASSTIGAQAGWATGTAVVAQTGGTSAVWSGSSRHGFDGRLGAVVLAGAVTGLVLTWELRGVL